MFQQGFTKRLRCDLKAQKPPNYKLRMLTSNNSTKRHFGAWFGGSILASSTIFQQMSFSRKEYNEEGKLEMYRKFL